MNVVNVFSDEVGIGVLRGITFSDSPPYVSTPKDKGSTSRRSISSFELPESTSACIAAPAATTDAAPTPAKEKPAPAQDDNLITVNSPMIGTFYRSSGPDKDAFVNVGGTFSVGDKLCIIEAMKTFNEIEAEISGKIVKVLVDDASPVDYDQPLFMVEPTA